MRIAVIGAGIVGVSAAEWLRRDGHEVTLIDRIEPGSPEQTSYGNAGILASGGIVQVAVPGLPAKAPRMLLDPLGPLHLRWSYLPRLMPWLDVADNVAFGLDHLSRAERRRLVGEALHAVGLERFAHALPRQLSGGMAQRTALARALVARPAVLLMDEPFSALDALTREAQQDHLLTVWAEHSPTLLLVTHDVGVARAVGHEVAVMYAGRLVETGPVDAVLGAPRHPYTAGLLEALPTPGVARGELSAIPGRPPGPDEEVSDTACAFAPSFLFVIVGGPRFDALRRSARVKSFLDGAGPAAIGAIGGSAVVLATGLSVWWQWVILALAALWLLALRRGVVTALTAAAALGVAATAVF